MKALIKCAEKSEYRAWITILAFLVVGVTGSVGQVWCLEADGHLNLEPGPGCSRVVFRDLPVSPTIIKKTSAQGQCLTCSDFTAFPVGLRSEEIRFNAPSEQLSGLSDVNFAPIAFSHLGSSQSLHTIPFLRTVVLII